MVQIWTGRRGATSAHQIVYLDYLLTETSMPTLHIGVEMQRFIPAKEVRGDYINLHKLFSFNWARVFGVIGARGYGKTFASKRKCLKDFKYHKKRFIIVRDTTAACDEICDNGGYKLFSDVFSLPIFQKDKYDVQKYTIFINDKNAGEVMPLSTYYKYKGNAYKDVAWVLFDEFIEESVQAYRGNRARQFANTLETIIRDNQSTRVVLTANALDLGNDILEVLDIHIKSGQYGYYINEEKGVVIYYAPNSPEFEKRKENSISSRITRGTFLDQSMNKNQFENTGCLIFERRKPCNLYGIYYNNEGECVRLYQERRGDTFYCCKDINSNSYNYMRYVFNAKQANADRILVENNVRQWLKRLLQTQQVQFESQYIFSVYCSIINNTMKK